VTVFLIIQFVFSVCVASFGLVIWFKNSIIPGVTVNSIAVGGLTPDRAVNLLQKSSNWPNADSILILTDPDGKSWNIKCKDIPKEKIAAWFCEILLNVKIFDIVKILKETNLDNILPSLIPQYSKMNDAIHNVVDILYKSGKENLTFDEIGYYLDGKEKNEVAQRKYGENHSKFASLLDLTSISAPNNVNHITLSVLGNAYRELPNEKRESIVARLAFRITIIQHIFVNALGKKIIISDYMHGLSEQTRKRRKPNVSDLINFIKKHSSAEMKGIYDQIKEKR